MRKRHDISDMITPIESAVRRDLFIGLASRSIQAPEERHRDKQRFHAAPNRSLPPWEMDVLQHVAPHRALAIFSASFSTVPLESVFDR
jgi:hypothetical protein